MAYIGDIRRKVDVVPLAASLAQTQMQLKQRQPHWMEVLGRVMGQVTGAIGAEEARKAEKISREAALELEKKKVSATELTAQARWQEVQNDLIKMGLPSTFIMKVGEGQETLISFNPLTGETSVVSEALISRASGMVDAGDRWAILNPMTGEETGNIPKGMVPDTWQVVQHEASGTVYAFNPMTGELKDVTGEAGLRWRQSQDWYQMEELKLATRKVAETERRLLLDTRMEEGDLALKIDVAKGAEKWKAVDAALASDKYSLAAVAQSHSMQMDEKIEKRHRLKDAADIEIAISASSRADMLARLTVLVSNTEMNLAQLKEQRMVEQQNFDQLQTLYTNATSEEKFKWKQLVDNQAMLIKGIETDIAITGMEIEQSRLEIDELNAWKPEKMAWHEAWTKLQNEGMDTLNPGELEILGIREPVAYVPTTMEEALELHEKKNKLNAKLGVGGAMTMEDREKLLDYERGIQEYLKNLTQEQKIEFADIQKGIDLEYLAEAAKIEWEVTRKELILKADLKGKESFKADDGTWWQYNDEGKLEVLLPGVPEKPEVVNIRLDDGRVAVGIIYPGDTQITWTDTFDGDTQAKQIKMITQAWITARLQVERQMGAFAMLDETLIPKYRREMTAAFVRTLISYEVPEERALALADPNWLLQAELGGAVFESGARISGVDTGAYIRGEAVEGEGVTFETPGGETKELEVVETPKVVPGKRLTTKEIASKTAVQVEAFKTLNDPRATKKLQQALKDAGVYKGKVDGVWSVAVERALEIAIRTNKSIADSLIIFKGSK